MTACLLRPSGVTIINVILCNYTHTGSHNPFTSEGLYRYSNDLLTLNSYSSPESQPIPACLTHITTPLNLEAWDMCLRNHPDRTFASYILSGISHGFHIGFNHETPIRSAKGNMSSAAHHAPVIEDYLKAELEANRILGPFQPSNMPCPIHISPIGIIPKRHQHNKWRLIVDISSPNGASINDGINPSFTSLSYIHIQDVIKQIMDLGPGALLAKIDIKSAYRIIPVHPSDRPLLGMSFQHQVYIDASLPFGLRSAPKIFNSLADALLWILLQHSVSHLLHYLDDFITMGRAATTQCQMNYDIIHSICELLGVPLAEDKCDGPCTLLEYLGFLLDTTKMTVSLPREKLNRLIHLIQSWSNRKTCTKHDLDSLIGQLQHASAVVKPGRSFLRRMIVLAKSRHLPSHPIRLNQGFRSDLAWWHLFLKQWNGISLMSAIGQEKPEFTVTTDASGSWGCGAHFSSHWFQLKWTPAAASHSIAFLELVPIVISGLVWGKHWKGTHVLCRCDNLAAVEVIQSRYSRDDNLMHLLRCLFFAEAAFNFTFLPQHLPGRLNEMADALSRNSISPTMLHTNGLDPHPTVIHREIPNLLLNMQVDWLSQTWTALFNSILSKV